MKGVMEETKKVCALQEDFSINEHVRIVGGWPRFHTTGKDATPQRKFKT